MLRDLPFFVAVENTMERRGYTKEKYQSSAVKRGRDDLSKIMGSVE